MIPISALKELNTYNLLRTIYVGDRWVKHVTHLPQEKSLRLCINRISRIRSTDGCWNYYNDENLKDCEIVFVGVEDVVFTPSGTTLNDAIHEIDCQTQANGTFKVTIFGDFIDEPAHTPISTSVELICASAYLVDKNNPDLKIRS